MNSSIDTSLWTLARTVSQAEAEKFVVELLNLDVQDPAAQRRFCADRRFVEMIPVMHGGITEHDRTIDQLLNEQEGNRLWILRGLLANAWRMPTPWDREIALLNPLYIMLADFHQAHAAQGMKPLEKRIVAAAKVIGVLLKLQRSAERLHFCGNPECPAPYFIARSSQKFCSEACAGPAQRAQKKAWWSSHGEEWRKKRERKRRK